MYLCHYTTIDALLHMIHTPTKEEHKEVEANENESAYGYYLTFHATDAYMMNDKMEHKLILEEMSDVIRKYNSKFQYETLSCGKPYIISFCKERDYLPMWQIYAKGGNGICLVFQFENDDLSLLNNLNESNREFSSKDIDICSCSYESKSSLQNLKKKWESDIEREYKGGNQNLISSATPFLHLFKDAIKYKSKDWEYEKEERLVCWKMYPQIKNGKNGICSYVEVKIPLLWLKEIIVGPSINQYINTYAIKEMIRVKGWDKLNNYGVDIKVTESKIALR